MRSGTVGVHAPDRSPGPAVLADALLRRELDLSLIWLALAAAALSTVAAYYAFGPSEVVATPMIGRLLQRFDFTLLAIVVPFMVLRIASRIEMDHQHGWIGPYVAAGGSRAAIGLLYSLVSVAVPAIVFAAGAISFGAAVMIIADSNEILRLLPRTLGGGLILLLSYAGLTVSVALVVRSAVTATTIVFVVAMLPQVLVMRHMMSDAALPLWTVLLQFAAPVLIIPSTLTGVLHGLGYGSAMALVAVLVAARRAGRMT